MVSRQGELRSWGRLRAPGHSLVPLRDACSAAASLRASPLPGVVFGNGRSYGDQALNEGGTAWLTRGLDRFIEFDPASGLLRCEAGMTLQEIIGVVLPHGWFLPVTPGTQFATLGGAVANDVHGKNHHRCGTLGEHVEALTLLRTDGQSIRCGPTVEAAWFCATVGGMGLTGLIVDVTLRLRRVPGPWMETETQVFETLDEFFELSAQANATWEYSVAWIDCLQARAGRTRGALFCGNHAASGEPLHPAAPKSVALLPPVRWVTPTVTRAFNALYFRRAAARAGHSRQSYLSFFYPLDGLLEWNRIYGPRGFYQYQCAVPVATQHAAIDALLREVAASASGSFLSVLKTFGARAPLGWLSFPMEGTTLALDFPNDGQRTLQLFERLDAIVAAAGGRLYPAKDATMPASLFRQGYPRLADFLPYRDPGISSEMSRRLLGH
jgi:FAD/FMN-containing dehydrogenase